MQRTLFSGLAATALLAIATILPASAAPGGSLVVPVHGLLNNAEATGTLNISRFETSDQKLFAVGTITMAPVGTPSQVSIIAARVPVVLPNSPSGAPASTLAPTAAAGPTCQILNLTLGPLDLDLLGLVVHLDQVNLNITAQQGAGNLLGNLLCAVANLLNGTNLSSLLQQLVNALKRDSRSTLSN